jgi:Ca-activated chloride channel family protein
VTGFANPWAIHLVWGAIALVVVLAIFELRGRDALGRLLSPVMQRRLTARPSTGRVIAKLILLLLSLLCVIAALTRPQGHGEGNLMATARSADIMVVLDVSRSMLASDVKPDRLSRARFEIGQMADELKDDRIGLIAFAGRAVPVCPLTSDHAFFQMVLKGVDTRSAARGGTRIGDAVRTAVKSFPTGPGAKLIVLITDGEDQDSFPLDAAEAAKVAGVRIVAIGLGSETGSQLEIIDPRTGAKEIVMHDGAPVISKLDAETLRKMALTTEGVYVPAGTSALDLKGIVEAHIKPIVHAQQLDDSAPVELYPWFLLPGLILLVLAVWVGSTTAERRFA